MMKQIYEHYTTEDFKVWNALFHRQMQQLPQVAAYEYLEGIKDIQFKRDVIPNFIFTNELLATQTGWQLEVVPGIIPPKEFFKLLSQKRFCATTWLRKMSQLDYLEEPDMFHDVFGHVPLLTNKPFCYFFERIGKLGEKHIDQGHIIEMLGRIYWFTIEFGLLRNKGELKIYGAGILSSYGETKFCLSNEPQYLPYNAKTVMSTPFRNDQIQDKYFVIDSFQQLYDSMDEIEAIVDKISDQ